MTTLLVGFDSAWTPTNAGSIVSILRHGDGKFIELGPPQVADFSTAEGYILQWQAEHLPTATVVMLDQPTIVINASGQRPVENIVGSPVSVRFGGMQPANTARAEMFGEDAPVWRFLATFGGAADPLAAVAGTAVFETYPVLTMIALGWVVPDRRPKGRLPKYNPERRKTFALSEWQYVCRMASTAFAERGLDGAARWLDEATLIAQPSKRDQDGVDAYLCLLVALNLAEGKDCLMIGDLPSGYIVVPYGAELVEELTARCRRTFRDPDEWVRAITPTLNLARVRS